MEYRKSPDNAYFIKKITSYYTIGSAIFIICCMVWGNDLLKILFPQQEYIISLQIFPIIMIGYLFYGWTDIFNFGIYVSNKFYYQSIVPIVGAILNCGLNLLLLPKYGVAISAYIFMITFLVAAILLLVISNKYYKLTMEWIRLSCTAALCLIVFVLLNIIDIGFGHRIIGKVSFTIIVFVVTWLFMVNKDERRHVVAYIKHFKK